MKTFVFGFSVGSWFIVIAYLLFVALDLASLPTIWNKYLDAFCFAYFFWTGGVIVGTICDWLDVFKRQKILKRYQF
jgi:hypothetical protein